MIDFTVIAACRGRYDSLRRFIYSVFGNAMNKDAVELYIMSDEDDPETRNVVQDFRQKHPTWKIVEDVQVRSQFLNRDYINKAATMSQGKYLWVLGNDMEIVTSNWDSILRNKIEEFVKDKPDRIAYVYVDDEIHKPGEFGGCCCPLVSRESVEALGWYMPPELPTWAADHWLWMIYKDLSQKRIAEEWNVRAIHYSHHTKRVPQDDINKEVERNAGNGKLDAERFNHYKWLLEKKINASREVLWS